MQNKPLLGMHYYPDEEHYTRQDAERWIPRLKRMGADWIVLRASQRRAIPENFLRAWIAADIEPVLHIHCLPNQIEMPWLSSLLGSYASWGLKRVIVMDRPNQRENWSASQWARGGLIEHYVDMLIATLDTQRRAGLTPIMPPLQPAGDYWDTVFLEASLMSLKRRGRSDLIGELEIAVYSWSFEHDLDWGMGGPARWPAARPYHTPKDQQDHRGVRLAEWYAEIARRVLGREIPFLSIAGGASDRMGKPLARGEKQAQFTRDCIAILQQNAIPCDLKRFAFYPLITEPTHPNFEAGWYESDAILEQEWQQLLTFGSFRNPKSRKQPKDKLNGSPKGHYILLNPNAKAPDSKTWASLKRIALTHPGIEIGFSTDRARRAEEVILVDFPFRSAIRDILEREGCHLQTIHSLPGTTKIHIPEEKVSALTGDHYD